MNESDVGDDCTVVENRTLGFFLSAGTCVLYTASRVRRVVSAIKLLLCLRSLTYSSFRCCLHQPHQIVMACATPKQIARFGAVFVARAYVLVVFV